jgi:hypothetical protein
MDGLAEVHKDVVKVVLGAEEPEDDPAMAKPGAKLQQLKEELQQQIAQRRAEEWGRRFREQQLNNEEEGESLATTTGVSLCRAQTYRNIKTLKVGSLSHKLQFAPISCL